jgi:hypothetical protein
VRGLQGAFDPDLEQGSNINVVVRRDPVLSSTAGAVPDGLRVDLVCAGRCLSDCVACQDLMNLPRIPESLRKGGGRPAKVDRADYIRAPSPERHEAGRPSASTQTLESLAIAELDPTIHPEARIWHNGKAWLETGAEPTQGLFRLNRCTSINHGENHRAGRQRITVKRTCIVSRDRRIASGPAPMPVVHLGGTGSGIPGAQPASGRPQQWREAGDGGGSA